MSFANPAKRGTDAAQVNGAALRIALLASHEGTTAQVVLDACATGVIRGLVAVVISNNANASVLRRAEAAGVPWLHLSSKTHPEPEELDRAIANSLTAANANVVVLAGYLKRLGPYTLDAFGGRIINTHPALLPNFGGQGMYGDRVHEAVIVAGVSVSGASVHLVTNEYDAGRVLYQREVQVLPDDDATSLGERVRSVERALLVRTLSEWNMV